MRDPISQYETLRKRRGDAQGYFFGGVMGLLLGGIYSMAQSGDFYLLGEVSYESRPVLFMTAMCLMLSLSVVSIGYGFVTARAVGRELSQLEPMHEADLAMVRRTNPLLRLFLTLISMLVMIAVLTPVVAVVGWPAMVVLFGVGLVLMAFGLGSGSYFLAGVGFGMKAAAGLGLWLVTN